MTVKQIDIDTLLLAYDAAGRALDRGMRRRDGATDAEWQAEDDARIKLSAARRAYVNDIREMITESAGNERRVRAGDHTCDRKGPAKKVIDESGDEPITAIYPSCSVCGKPQVFVG